MEPITVKTPGGVGRVQGIDRGEVIVEHDYQYLVGYPIEQVERIEEGGMMVICEMDFRYLVAFTPEEVEFLERRRCKWWTK